MTSLCFLKIVFQNIKMSLTFLSGKCIIAKNARSIVWLCRLGMTFCFSEFCCVYLCVGDSIEQNIFDHTKTTNQIMVVDMLKN